MLSVLSFGGPFVAHGELLPVVDPYQGVWFEPFHNLGLGVTRMLLRLTAVQVLFTLPRAGEILNRMNFFL